MLSSAAGGLMPAGTAFTSTVRPIFPPSLLSWSCYGEETKEITSRTNFNPFAPRYWRKVVQTKSRRTLVFDPDSCSGRLRGCPFLGGRRTLLRGGVRLGHCDGIRGWNIFVGRGPSIIIFKKSTSNLIRRILLRHIATFPKPERQVDRVMARACETAGINGC